MRPTDPVQRTTPVGADVLFEETVAGPAGPELLDAMEAALARFWSSAGAPEEGRRTGFDAAVIDVAGMAIERAAQTQGGGKTKLRLRGYADRVEAILTDRGAPHDEPDEGDPALARARAAVDRLEYSRRERGSNRWRLVKRRG